MKYSQKNAQVSPVSVPETLLGKRAAIFFLLNEAEMRKASPASAEAPEKATSNAAEGTGVINLQSKVLLLTDEFIFS